MSTELTPEKSETNPFAASTFVGIGSVRVSETTLSQPSGIIRDLAPGEWAYGQPTSVIYDEDSKLLLIDTFDSYAKTIDRKMIEQNPAIMRVVARIGNLSVASYIADLSHIKSLHHRHLSLGIKDGDTTSPRLEQRIKSRGTEFLGGVILREFDSSHYYGEGAFVDQAAEFKVVMEDFAYVARKSAKPLTIPVETYSRQL